MGHQLLALSHAQLVIGRPVADACQHSEGGGNEEECAERTAATKHPLPCAPSPLWNYSMN